jgi:dipeptidyl aminopeptidase/acylaminoacyl peptidase
VEVHGGPTGQFFRGFNPYAQFLADRGFILIEPNVRGSTGYGVEFRDACLKDWGGKDLEDVEGAVNYLKSLPEVDPERIGVFGGSYGGYMAFMAVTKKPHLWKAGVAWVGISDLHALYDYSQAQMKHFAYFLREQMGDPVEDADLWRDRSAINFAGQMAATLLMVHGVNDPRCPVAQSRLFRDRLLQLGRVEGEDFEYVELGEEGHGSTDIDQKIRTFKILADFLERRL